MMYFLPPISSLIRKKGLFIVLVLGIPFFLVAQSAYEAPAKLKWGKEYKGKANTFLEKVITSGPEGVFMLRQKAANAVSVPNTAFLELYDKNMSLARGREIDLKYKGKLRELEDVILLGGELYLLTSYHNLSQKKKYLFYQAVSREKLIVDRQLNLLAEAPSKGMNKVGYFDFHISEDSTKLLVMSQEPYRKKEPERFSLNVFGKDMTLLWEKDLVLPYNDDQFLVEEFRVDDDGNVYVLGVVFFDEVNRRRDGQPTYEYRVLAYRDKGEDVEEYTIGVDNRFVTDLTFRIGRDGHLVFCGFYSEKGTYSIRGTCFFRMDPRAKKLYNFKLESFEFGFLTRYLSDGAVERAQRAEESGNVDKQPELYDYNLKDLILRSDGGGLLVAEQTFIRRQNIRYFNGDWRVITYYYYNDIIVVNLNPDGEIAWEVRIPKQQITVDDGGYYSSFAMSIIRDRIYFVYNEHPRNFEAGLSPSRYRAFDGTNSVIALAEVNRFGELVRYPLASNREAAVRARPKACKQIGRREMMVLGERGRRYRLARLLFE